MAVFCDASCQTNQIKHSVCLKLHLRCVFGFGQKTVKLKAHRAVRITNETPVWIQDPPSQRGVKSAALAAGAPPVAHQVSLTVGLPMTPQEFTANKVICTHKLHDATVWKEV